jgi:hypothetical protein
MNNCESGGTNDEGKQIRGAMFIVFITGMPSIRIVLLN